MNVFELYGSLGLKTEEFSKKLNAAGNSFKDFSGEITSNVGTIVDVIKGIAGTVATVDNAITATFDKTVSTVIDGITEMSSAIFNFTKASVQTGLGFDTVMSNIAATMGKSRDEINKTVVQTENFTGTLGEFAEKLGAETKFTTAQAAEGLLILSQAGLTAEEQVKALPPILDLASAGMLDLDTAATYVTASVMGFRDSMENASYYADMIAKGATLAKTDVNMLGAAFSGAAATATTYNQSAQSTETALLRLANMNVTGMEAANAYNRVMMDLYAATDKSQAALEELGISMYDAATGEARDLNDVVADLNNALSGLNDEERIAYENTIFSAWGMKAFDKMAATSEDTLSKFNEELSNVSGAATQQAGTQLEALSGKLAILNSAFEGVQISISKMIMPELGSFVEHLSAGLGDVKEQLEQGDFKGGFYALGNTIVDLIDQGADDILNSEDEATSFVDGLIVFANKVVGKLIERGAELLPSITDFLTETGTKAINAIYDIVNDPEKFGKIIGTINLVLTKIQTFLDENEDKLYTIFDKIFDSSIGIVEKIFVLKRKTIGDILIRKIKEVWSDVTEEGKRLFEEAKDDYWAFWQPIGDSLWEFISTLPKKWESNFQPLGDAIWNTIDLTGKRVKKWWDEQKEQIIAIKDWFLNGWSEFANGWTNKVTEIIDSVKEAFGQVKLAITDIADKAKTWGSDLIDNFISGISSMKDRLGEKANEIANTISEFLHFSLPEKGPLSESDEWMPDFMSNLAQGIEQNRGLVQDAIKDVAGDMQIDNSIVAPRKSPESSRATNGNSYVFEFRIGNVNGTTARDAENFAENVSQLLRAQVFREQAAYI